MIPSNERNPLVAASYWIPPVCLCIIIFLISSQPAPSVVPGFRFADKLVHAIIYFILSDFFYRAFLSGGPALGVRAAALVALIVAALYGLSDEFHQYFVPSRQAEVGDALADLFGAALGALAGWLVWKGRAGHRITGVSK